MRSEAGRGSSRPLKVLWVICQGASFIAGQACVVNGEQWAMIGGKTA